MPLVIGLIQTDSTIRYHFTPILIAIASNKQKIRSVGKHMKKLGPCALLVKESILNGADTGEDTVS